MSVAEILIQAADIFDKTAEYLEKTEASRLAAEKQAQDKKAQALAAQISDRVGEELDTDLIQKLSSISPDVQDLLGRLTGGGEVDSLGGPPESEKTASVDGVLPEDVRLLSWITSS